MAGYSGTPLWKKLGYKSGLTAFVDDGPDQYGTLLSLPSDVEISWLTAPKSGVEFVHLFAVDKATLGKKLKSYRQKMAPDSVLWVSWPKKASGVATDITEDRIRDAALP